MAPPTHYGKVVTAADTMQYSRRRSGRGRLKWRRRDHAVHGAGRVTCRQIQHDLV